MKKTLLFLFSNLFTCYMFAQVGYGTHNPDSSSVLELKSSRRGVLIPRIDIPNLQQSNPVTDPAHSLLVYNTHLTTEGFYYWDSSANSGAGAWISILSKNNTTVIDYLLDIEQSTGVYWKVNGLDKEVYQKTLSLDFGSGSTKVEVSASQIPANATIVEVQMQQDDTATQQSPTLGSAKYVKDYQGTGKNYIFAGYNQFYTTLEGVYYATVKYYKN